MGAGATRLADVYQSDMKTHPLFAPLEKVSKIDPETFGKMAIYAWAALNGRSDLPDRDELIGELIAHRKSLPDEGSDVLHVDVRSIGEPSIAEYSAYMAAAQEAGLIKRYNPAYIRCFVEVGKIEAKDRLAEFKETHGDLVDWLLSRMKNLSQR